MHLGGIDYAVCRHSRWSAIRAFKTRLRSENTALAVWHSAISEIDNDLTVTSKLLILVTSKTGWRIWKCRMRRQFGGRECIQVELPIQTSYQVIQVKSIVSDSLLAILCSYLERCRILMKRMTWKLGGGLMSSKLNCRTS